MYVKHFSMNNVNTSLGFVNSGRFLRKKQLFYTTLSGIVFPTWRQVEGKNSCLGYESHPKQSLTLNLVDLFIPVSIILWDPNTKYLVPFTAILLHRKTWKEWKENQVLGKLRQETDTKQCSLFHQTADWSPRQSLPKKFRR